jgi:hypothetical protein
MKNLTKQLTSLVLLLILSSCNQIQVSLPISSDSSSAESSGPVDTIALKIKSPLVPSGLTGTPTITVYGDISFADVVNLYSDANCTTLLATGVAGGVAIDLTTSSLPLGKTVIYAGIEVGGVQPLSCHFANLTYFRDECPSGYEETPDYSGTVYEVDPFCVMKYEAKAWKDTNGNGAVDEGEVNSFGCAVDVNCGGDGVSFATAVGVGIDDWAGTPNSSGTTWTGDDWKPISIGHFSPWREISIVGALNRCRSLGSKYDLISNYEFMAIARDIEAVASNTIAGCLKQGNSGFTTCGSYDSGTDPDSDSVGARNNRAEFELSNGNILLDYAGNVLEWVTFNKLGPYNFLGSANCSAGWTEPNDLDAVVPGLCNLFSNEHYKPASAIDSSNGTGKIIIKNAEQGYLKRGGHWSQGGTNGKGGLYSMTVRNDTSYSYPNVGFRCVYRP